VSQPDEDPGARGGSFVLLLKNLLFTFVVPGTVAVYVPLSLAGDRAIDSGLWPIVAWPLLVLGCAIYAWCVWDFASFGRGTPAPIDAPSRLVVRGLYRYSRNPMYVGVLSVILGQAALFEAPRILLWGLGVGLCFQLFVLLYEEPHLTRVFGPSYREYRTRVGRWLPRLGGVRRRWRS
jgi:protein-S-isoprenylcysteine O-methyltransferase Ste14